MKNLLIAGSMLAAFGASSFGATMACNGANTNLSFSTAAIDSTGYTCGDKLFSGISSGAAGTITLSEVDTNLYKFTFIPNGGSISSAFSLGFTVALIAPSTNLIQSFQDQMLTAAVSGNSIPNGSMGTITHTGGSPNPDVVTALTAQSQTGFVTFGSGVTNTTVMFQYNPTGSAGQPAGLLLSQEFAITESVNAVPEPMTFSLMGGALLVLGAIGRRRKVSA